MTASANQQALIQDRGMPNAKNVNVFPTFLAKKRSLGRTSPGFKWSRSTMGESTDAGKKHVPANLMGLAGDRSGKFEHDVQRTEQAACEKSPTPRRQGNSSEEVRDLPQGRVR